MIPLAVLVLVVVLLALLACRVHHRTRIESVSDVTRANLIAEDYKNDIRNER